MRNQRTRLLVLVATLVALFALAPQGMASAHSGHADRPLTPTCVQQHNALDCNNQDPYNSGCDGSNAVTLLSSPIVYQGTHIGDVDLRWSNNCSTNWARIDNVVGGSIGGYVRDETCWYYGHSQDYGSNCPNDFWTIKVGEPWTMMLWLPNDDACVMGEIYYHNTWVQGFVNQLQYGASGGTQWGMDCNGL